MGQFQGIIGVLFIIFLCYLLSNNKKAINYKTIVWGLGLQIFFALIILVTPIGKPFFNWFDKAINKLLTFSVEGSKFLFEQFGTKAIEGPLLNFAFIALPTVIFFSALMAMMYHFGIMQKIVALISKIMQKTMGTSGAETTSISANIFVGQTEAPLVVKPFISKMTKSELMAIMVGGFATVAGGVMAIYVATLGNIDGIAGHLLAASIMSAPAALVVAKIMYPETEDTMSSGDIKMTIKKQDDNGLEALARGSSDGLKLAANIAAMLVAFVAFIALVNYLLGLIPIGDGNLSIELILGYLFQPLAWMMGAPWDESQTLGSLMGQKLVLTELVAYLNLSEMGGEISQRTAILASYALCGFANFASIGIQLGGIGSIAPDRKKDLSKIVFKAMIGGALASWLTASIAGIMISVPEVTTPEAFKDFTSKIVVKDEDGNDIINDTMSISFIYNHANSKDGLHMVTVRLEVIDIQSRIKTPLIGECVFNEEYGTIKGDQITWLSDPCIFKKEKTLYDNSSYTIVLGYNKYIEKGDFLLYASHSDLNEDDSLNKEAYWMWTIETWEENQNTIQPVTFRIGKDYFNDCWFCNGEEKE